MRLFVKGSKHASTLIRAVVCFKYSHGPLASDPSQIVYGQLIYNGPLTIKTGREITRGKYTFVKDSSGSR